MALPPPLPPLPLLLLVLLVLLPVFPVVEAAAATMLLILLTMPMPSGCRGLTTEVEGFDRPPPPPSPMLPAASTPPGPLVGGIPGLGGMGPGLERVMPVP